LIFIISFSVYKVTAPTKNIGYFKEKLKFWNWSNYGSNYCGFSKKLFKLNRKTFQNQRFEN